MPQATNQRQTDLRPYGAAAGAGLPGYALYDYLAREYPQFKAMLDKAEDATLPNGNVDLRKVLDTLKPGDMGISGVHGGNDAFTSALVYGSHGASGGIGAHGQIAGPYVRTPWRVANTPKGEMGPPLPFLANERGELYGKQLMRKPEEFLAAMTNDPGHTGGAERYGLMKEQLRARSKTRGELQKRVKEWAKYDAAQAAGNTSVAKPSLPRPDATKLDRVKKLHGGSAERFKKFIKSIDPNEFAPTGEIHAPTGKPKFRLEPFFGGPQTEAADFSKQLDAISPANQAARKARIETLAKRFDDMAAANPKFKALAQELRASPGVPAVRPMGGFKPKRYETFIPSLFHGGMTEGAVSAAKGPIDYAALSVPSVLDAGKADGIRGALGQIMDNIKDYKYYVPEQKARDAARVLRRPGDMLSYKGDDIWKHTAQQGSSLNPAGYYGERYGTLWLRPPAMTEETLLKGLQQKASLPYHVPGAGQAALGDVTGINKVRALMGGGKNVCTGHHCGSFLPAVYEATGAIPKQKLPHLATLPNRAALNSGFEPLLATNKNILYKNLYQGAGRRIAGGIGAMGLMGAAGYGVLGAAQGAYRAMRPAAPAQPQLDPKMLSQAARLFNPPK